MLELIGIAVNYSSSNQLKAATEYFVFTHVYTKYVFLIPASKKKENSGKGSGLSGEAKESELFQWTVVPLTLDRLLNWKIYRVTTGSCHCSSPTTA